MLSIIFISIMAMGIVGAVGYSALMIERNTETVVLAQQNKSQMDLTVDLLRAAARVVGGGVALPMGDVETNTATGGAYPTRLPSWLSANATTPWGASYAYCPYASGLSSVASSTAATVTEGDGTTSYSVGTAPSPGGGSTGYVVSGGAPPAALSGEAILAVITSPLPGASQAPDCDDVVLDPVSGRPRIGDGARVHGAAAVVTLRSVDFHAATSDFAPTLYVAPATQGSGSGLLPSSAMALTDALASWAASGPRSMTMMLASGTYTLAQSDLSVLLNARGAPGRGLRFVGTTGTMLSGAASGETMALPVDAAFENVGVGSGIALQAMAGTRLRIANSSVGPVQSYGADILFDTGDVVSSPILAYGGRITMNSGTFDTLASNAADVVISGTVVFSGADAGTAGSVMDVKGGHLSIQPPPGQSSGTTVSVSLPSSASWAAGLRLDGTADADISGSSASIATPGTGQAGIVVQGAGSLVARQSTIATSGNTAIALSAEGLKVGLYGTGLTMTGQSAAGSVGIMVSSGLLDIRPSQGTSSVLWGTTAGTFPGVGIVDRGASALSGDATSWVHASLCFQGYLFDPQSFDATGESVLGNGSAADANAQAEGAASARSYMNRAAWTCGVPAT